MFDNRTFATICNYAKKNFLSERLQSELSEKANDNVFMRNGQFWGILIP